MHRHLFGFLRLSLEMCYCDDAVTVSEWQHKDEVKQDKVNLSQTWQLSLYITGKISMKMGIL